MSRTNSSACMRVSQQLTVEEAVSQGFPLLVGLRSLTKSKLPNTDATGLVAILR